MSAQDKVEQGLKFVDLIKKGYLDFNKKKLKLQEQIQPVKQLNAKKKQEPSKINLN